MPEELDDELQEMYEDPKRRERTLSNEVLRLPIKALRLQNAVTLPSSATVQTAIEEMQKNKIGCVLLIKSKKLVGIFTERDFLYKVAGKTNDLKNIILSDYCTPNPESLQMDDSIGHALNLMHIGGYRHIPIVNGYNEPLGVISIKDAVGFLSEYFPEDVLNIPSKPIRVTTEREGA
jgi:CBS domain-containing protein